jgi:hypothetical protein
VSLALAERNTIVWFGRGPAVYWSIDRETVQHTQREPKSRHPAHE